MDLLILFNAARANKLPFILHRNLGMFRGKLVGLQGRNKEKNWYIIATFK